MLSLPCVPCFFIRKSLWLWYDRVSLPTLIAWASASVASPASPTKHWSVLTHVTVVLFTCCQYSFNVLRFLLPCLLQYFAICLHVSAGSRSAANLPLGLSVHVRTEFWDSYTWKVFCLSAPELLCGEQATSLNVTIFICTWHLDGDLEKSLDGSVAVWSGAYCSLLSAAVESQHEQLWDSLHLDQPDNKISLLVVSIQCNLIHSKNKYMSNMLHYTYFLCMHHSCSRQIQIDR